MQILNSSHEMIHKAICALQTWVDGIVSKELSGHIQGIVFWIRQQELSCSSRLTFSRQSGMQGTL